jgi:hypothetical protein
VAASSNAVSLASDPEAVKNTLASGIGESSAIRSASSTWARIRYTVEVWRSLPTCSWIASTISGTLWPEIVVRMPPKKSR